VLGDGSGNVRVPGTDLVIFRLTTSTGRVQFGHLPRVLTGELVSISGTYTTPAFLPSALAQGAIVLVERLSGRAPCGWRVVPDSLNL
jgi:hypothetical protein